MKKIFLHVGYPKTGTTSLQRNLFRKHSQVFNIRSEVEGIKGIREVIRGNTSFEPDYFRNNVEVPIRKREEKTGMYSEEEFTNNLKNTIPASIDRYEIARRLREMFTLEGVSTEVILVIREQRSILKSAFAFWYHKYRSMGYGTLDKIIHDGIEKKDDVAHNILKWISYFETINSYRRAFGNEKVNVLLYESLKNNEESFVRHLSQIMNICKDESMRLIDSSANRNVTKADGKRYSPSKMYHWLSVLKSEYLPDIGPVRSSAFGRWIVDQLRKGGSEISFSESSVARLRDFYGEENQRLEKEFNLPVSEHGYLVS